MTGIRESKKVEKKERLLKVSLDYLLIKVLTIQTSPAKKSPNL
jgi:hypothetical protein